MARRAGQIIARGASTWLVRVYLGRDSQTGTRKYLNQTIHGPLREAQRFLNLKLQQRDNARVPRAADLCLSDRSSTETESREAGIPETASHRGNPIGTAIRPAAHGCDSCHCRRRIGEGHLRSVGTREHFIHIGTILACLALNSR